MFYTFQGNIALRVVAENYGLLSISQAFFCNFA